MRYYAAVAEGALRGVAGRPIVLKHYVDGVAGEPFFQKRPPEQRPEWVETVELRFPSGRTVREIVVRDAAELLWMVNLGCIDLNPHPVSADDLDHPDELRVDLVPRIALRTAQKLAGSARRLCAPWSKTGARLSAGGSRIRTSNPGRREPVVPSRATWIPGHWANPAAQSRPSTGR